MRLARGAPRNMAAGPPALHPLVVDKLGSSDADFIEVLLRPAAKDGSDVSMLF